MQEGIVLIVRGEVIKRSEGTNAKGVYRSLEVATRRGSVKLNVESAEHFATCPPEGSECTLSVEVEKLEPGVETSRDGGKFPFTKLGKLKFVKCEGGAIGAARPASRAA